MPDFDPPPIPVEPIPVAPLPENPYAYTPYASPGLNARPGIITAIGVCSIVIASLGILGGGAMLMVNMVVTTMARFPTHAQAVPVTPTAKIAPGPAELLGPDGTPAVDRVAIVNGLAQIRPLSELQRGQLDELLAEEGKSVLPLAGPDITPEQIAANVSRSGHLSTNSEAGAEYFALGNGRLELSDDRAVFFPTNGQPSLQSNSIAIPAASTSTLQPDQIRSVIRAIDRMNINRIKSGQSAAIIALLEGPGQQVIVPTTNGSDPAGEVTAAVTDSDDGSLSLTTHHGSTDCSITLDTDGKITSTNTTTSTMTGTSSSTFSYNETTTITANGAPYFNRNASQWVSFLTGIQMLLAIYLLICGIFILRQGSFIGRRMHWIYVGIKLPIAIAAAATTYWLWSGSTAGNATSWATFGFVLPAMIGLIYPVVLLLVLSTSEGVRTYFAAGRYAA